MAAKMTVPHNLPTLKRFEAGRGKDSCERLLAALAIFAVTVSTISIGVCLVVIARAATAIDLVLHATPK